MVPTPQLNLDVIHALVSFLGTQELIQLSVVCKLYHGPALKQLLSGVTLHMKHQLIGFGSCVLADATARAPWINTLEIDETVFMWDQGPIDEPDDADIVDFLDVSILAAVLEHCHGLVTLRIPLLGRLLMADSQLGTSIASLQGLKRLDLCDVDNSPLIPQLVSNMQSQLRELRLQYHSFWKYPDLPLRDMATSASTANIMFLELCNVTFPPTGDQYSPWMKVHRIDALNCCLNLHTMPSIVPNLQTCRLSGDATRVMPHGDSTRLWPTLDVLELDYDTIAQLTWSGCPVRDVSLKMMSSYPSNPVDMLMLIDLLRESQPVVLSLGTVGAQTGLRFWRMLCMVTPNLRCLKFLIEPDLVEDRVALMTCLLSLLVDLPLIFLSIDLSAFGFPPPLPSYSLRMLARMIRTLHYLEIAPGPNGHLATWQITRPETLDDGPQLKLLSDSEGQEVQERLWSMDRESLLHFDISKFIST